MSLPKTKAQQRHEEAVSYFCSFLSGSFFPF